MTLDVIITKVVLAVLSILQSLFFLFGYGSGIFSCISVHGLLFVKGAISGTFYGLAMVHILLEALENSSTEGTHIAVVFLFSGGVFMSYFVEIFSAKAKQTQQTPELPDDSSTCVNVDLEFSSTGTNHTTASQTSHTIHSGIQDKTDTRHNIDSEHILNTHAGVYWGCVIHCFVVGFTVGLETHFTSLLILSIIILVHFTLEGFCWGLLSNIMQRGSFMYIFLVVCKVLAVPVGLILGCTLCIRTQTYIWPSLISAFAGGMLLFASGNLLPLPTIYSRKMCLLCIVGVTAGFVLISGVWVAEFLLYHTRG